MLFMGQKMMDGASRMYNILDAVIVRASDQTITPFLIMMMPQHPLKDMVTKREGIFA